MRVGSGVPGNGTVRQSANAQSELAIETTPLFTPAGVSDATETSVALAVSSVAGIRPAAPGSGCVLTPPATLTKRAQTRPVTADPSARFATGTSIPSRTAPTEAMGRSPCQPLHSTACPSR